MGFSLALLLLTPPAFFLGRGLRGVELGGLAFGPFPRAPVRLTEELLPLGLVSAVGFRVELSLGFLDAEKLKPLAFGLDLAR